MRFTGLLALFCIISLVAKAQTDTLPGKALFHKNHITFNLQHGFTRGQSAPESGPYSLDPRTGYVYHANLNYTAHISDKFGATAGAGVGAFPFIFELYDLDLGRMPYFDDVSYNLFASLKGEINYRHKLSDKYILNGFAGASAVSLQEFQMSTGLTSSSQTDYVYRVRINFEKGWKPLAHIGTGISRVLPNHDLLTLRLDYNHSFKDFYSGTYSILPKTPDASKGKYFNSGNHLSFGLGYTFTRVEKNNKTQQYVKDGGRKNADNDYKKEKRIIKDGSTMLAMYGGITFPLNSAADPNNIFQDATLVNLMPYFSLEHNLKKNYYAELGFGLQEYFSATKIKGDIGTSGGNAFMAYQTSLGGGKRLIGRTNNYNYLNIAGGVVLNVIDRQVGLSGGSGGAKINQNNDTVFSFSSDNYVRNRISPLLYIGVSKDFRISGGFYLSLLYRYHQGFYKLYEQQITYTSTEFTNPQNAIVSMNGSFHTAQLGVKFNLDNLSQRNIKRQLIPFQKGTFLLSALPSFIYNRNRTTYTSTDHNGSYNQSWNTFSPGIGAEYFLNDKNYLEARANYYGEGTFTMGMNIVSLSAGFGRRMNLPNGLNIINVQTGFSLSQIHATSGRNESRRSYNYREDRDDFFNAAYDSKSKKGTLHYGRIKNNDTTRSSATTFGIRRSLFPTIYLGVSKDFRLSNKWSAGVSFYRHFGFGDFYVEDSRIINYENDYFRREKIAMNGTASQLLFNLKYRLK